MGGFDHTCVETVNYTILVNNQPMSLIQPGRGLSQGDHLSPYLFILCVEGLSTLIAYAEEQWLLHGTKICRGAPIIPHLLFGDDYFLLGVNIWLLY